jgi:hypothetical protein
VVALLFAPVKLEVDGEVDGEAVSRAVRATFESLSLARATFGLHLPQYITLDKALQPKGKRLTACQTEQAQA